MYDAAFTTNGGIKPIPTEKLRSLLTQEEIDSLPKHDDLKAALFMARHNIDENLCKCPCGKWVSLKTIKKIVKENKDLVRTCSKSCATKYGTGKRKQAILDRFGGQENYNQYLKEMQRKNSLEKYGMLFQSLPSTKNNRIATMIERYGVDHNSKLDTVKSSRLIEEDGKLIDVLRSKESIEKRRDAFNNRSEEERKQTYNKFIETRKSRSKIRYDILDNITERVSIEELSATANCSFMTAYRVLSKKGLIDTHYTEATIGDYLDSLGVSYLKESRKIIRPLELDYYIDDLKLAIEYNGLYWHSSNNEELDKKWKDYHLRKTNLCLAKGITLLHIFEDEWVNLEKRDVWKSIINHKLGLSKRIPARKCVRVRIGLDEANEFCKINSLEGVASDCDVCYGLFHNDVLVQIAIIKGDEAIRICTKKYHAVQGGISKLLNGIDCKCVANRRWTKHTLDDMITEPKFYVFTSNKVSCEEYTEDNFSYDTGLRRIWDCGNVVFNKTSGE